MVKDIQNISLLDILPSSILADEKVAAAAKALDKELQAVTAATQEILHLPRLDILPEKVIDLLAWQWHVDFYEPIDMDIETKRALIKESIAWHRHKGTPWAVEQVVTAAVADATIHEWFEYGGEPGMFRIETGGFKDENTFKDLIQAIHVAKNTRSHLDRIIINGNKNKFDDENMLKYKVGMLNCSIGRKQINIPTPKKTTIRMTAGIAHLQVGKKTLGLSPPAKIKNKIYIGQYICRMGRITIGGIR